MQNRSLASLATAALLAVGVGSWACSSSPGRNTGGGTGGAEEDTGGKSGSTGGSTGSTGGKSGSTGGATGTGGATSTGGATGTGGAGTGGAGTGGTMGGTGGSMGGTDAGADGGGMMSADAGPSGPMMLTSMDLIMAQGQPMWQLKPEQCRRNNAGAHNESPGLTWTAGPAGTMSYAISFYDMTNNGTHWVLYNIPPTVTSLPAKFNKTSTMPMEIPGSRQTMFGGETGYFGPGADCRAYRFEVWALKVAQLPMAGTNNAIRSSLPANLVNPMARAKLDVRGQNSGSPCGPIGGYTP